jgi:hypothetical protein
MLRLNRQILWGVAGPGYAVTLNSSRRTMKAVAEADTCAVQASLVKNL